MKRKIGMIAEGKKQGLFGKKKILEERIAEVDGKTYKKMQKERRNLSYSIEEMMLNDELFDEWDD